MVSVGLCTYNGARFLAQQLESIAAQTHPVAVVHVSDDGSSDETLEIISRMSARLPLRLTRRPHRLGPARNFEATLAETSSDLVLLCDQDDVWHPRKVEAMVAAYAARPDALLLASDARVVSEDGRVRSQSLAATLGVENSAGCSSFDWLKLLLKRNRIAGATVAVTRPLLELGLPFPDGYWHDEWLALLASCFGRMVWIDTALTDYRQHGSNAAGLNQIGLAATVLGAARGGREHDRQKARRFTHLEARLQGSGLPVPSNHRALVQSATTFWSERAALPRFGWTRWRWIAVTARSGSYATFAEGMRSAVRDLVAC